jgi:hypothetical protein
VERNLTKEILAQDLEVLLMDWRKDIQGSSRKWWNAV